MFIRMITTILITLLTTGLALADQHHSTRAAHVHWINKNSANTVTNDIVVNIVAAAHKYAAKANIDPVLILAIIKAESGYKHKAANKYGARGLMQVVPRYHRDKIGNRDILNISTNIEVGVQILDNCLKSRKEDLNKALSCYSGGAGKKYLSNIRNAYYGLKRSDVKLRFEKELPAYTTTRWGVARIQNTPSTLLAATNLNVRNF